MLKNLNEMSATEKNVVMKGLVKKYRDAKSKYDILAHHEFYPKRDYSKINDGKMVYDAMEVKLINYIDQKEELIETIHHYDAILEQLDDRSKEIITKDFISPDGYYSQWWIAYYSKSSYYRARRKAVDCFLSYLID